MSGCLMALYEATAGDGWFNCAGTKQNPCGCEGTCNEGGTAVVAILLAGSNLVGALPPSIGDLTEPSGGGGASSQVSSRFGPYTSNRRF